VIASRLGLDPGEAVVASESLTAVRRELRALGAAVTDLERARSSEEADVALRRVRTAAANLQAVDLEPRALIPAA
jgi:hypothetical protein